MKTKKEISDFLDEKMKQLKMELTEFIESDLREIIEEEERRHIQKIDDVVIEEKDYIDFIYPCDVVFCKKIIPKNEKLVLRYMKATETIVVFYKDEEILDTGKLIVSKDIHRKIKHRFEIDYSKTRRDIVFSGGGLYGLARLISLEINRVNKRTYFKHRYIATFIKDHVRLYLRDNVYFK